MIQVVCCLYTGPKYNEYKFCILLLMVYVDLTLAFSCLYTTL